jgi:predicted unusual protein kinase regulating ubiquinone biosynthesis (AarF/ABC1/UbiB family)
MLLADGRAALLDFGQCKRLDRTQRAKVAQLMLVLNCRNLKMLKYGMEMTQVQFIQVQISVVVPTLCCSPLCVPVAMRTEHSTAF